MKYPPWWSRFKVEGGSAEATGRYLAQRFLIDCQDDPARVPGVAASLGVRPPAGWTPAGALQRALSANRWRAYVEVESRRIREQRRRERGLVRRGAGLYVSDQLFREFLERDREGRQFLEAELVAISDHDDVVSVAELSDRSVSNPEHRRAEMMIRIQGMERYCDQRGWPACFVTVTLAGEWHAYYEDSARPVPGYNRSRADEAHEHLKLLWARCRAEYGRLGVEPIGVRCVEPHHDGTPHWHMLLWFESEARRAEFKWAVQRYFDPDRDPADPSKALKFEDLEPGKGADRIASYVAKNIANYLSKGIAPDGEHPDAARATVWARLNGCRQFQFLGGPSVTVWRELRRCRNRANEIPTALRPAFEAAVATDWCAFMEALEVCPVDVVRGWKTGINGERTPERNVWEEPLLTADYDLRPIVGLQAWSEYLQTYQKFWTIAGKEELLRLGAERSALTAALGPRAGAASAPRPATRGAVQVAGSGGVAAWSDNNNCTEPRGPP